MIAVPKTVNQRDSDVISVAIMCPRSTSMPVIKRHTIYDGPIHKYLSE